MQARALELAQQDKVATSLTQPRRVKKEKDALSLAKDKAKKARSDVEAKLKASRKLRGDIGAKLKKVPSCPGRPKEIVGCCRW